MSTRLFGDTNLGVRFPALACGAALPALQAALAREAGLGDREAAFVGLFSSASILASAGSFVVGPDAPLSVLWLLAAIGLVRAAARADPRPLVLAALAAGLAAWAKLTALLLPGVVLLVPSLRRLFARAPMAAAAWLLLAIGALVVTRGAIAFQLRHGLAVSAPLWAAPLRWIETLGAQVLLLSPFVVWEAVRGARGGGAATRTLVWLAALPVVAVLVSALVAHTEANWAGPAHAAIFVLAARAFLARPPGAARVRLLALALTFVLVPSAVLHVHAARPLWTRADPTTRLHDGRRRAERPDGSYGDCALARYYDVTSPRCPRLRGTR